MRVDVWVAFKGKIGRPAVKLCERNVSFVPRQGDEVELHEDWGLFTVRKSYLCLSDDSVEITIEVLDDDELARLRRDLGEPEEPTDV